MAENKGNESKRKELGKVRIGRERKGSGPGREGGAGTSPKGKGAAKARHGVIAKGHSKRLSNGCRLAQPLPAMRAIGKPRFQRGPAMRAGGLTAISRIQRG